MSIGRAIGSKLWKLLVSILAIFRRAICRRRRRISDTPLPITVVTSNKQTVSDLESWSSWGDEQSGNVSLPDGHYPTNYGDNQFAHKDTKTEAEEVEVDFFSDMVPQYVKPKTAYIQHLEDEKFRQERAMHRLAMDDMPIIQSNELGTWEETSGTWEEEAECDIDTTSVIKEERRRDRERKAAERQKKKAEWTRNKKEHLGIRVQ